MQYTAAADYPITVDYYSTANTNTDPLGQPIWVDTFIREVKVQMSVDPGRDNLIYVYTQQALALGYVLKNFRNPDGVTLFNTAVNEFGIDYSAYLIKSVDPQINVFGYSEGTRYKCVPLSSLRRA